MEKVIDHKHFTKVNDYLKLSSVSEKNFFGEGI